MTMDLGTVRPTGATRLALAIGGVAAIAFGIAILVQPESTIVVVTGLVAAYAIVTGVVYVAMGIFSKHLGAGGRVAEILLGLLFVAAGVVAFTGLERSAAFLAVFVTVMLGFMWIMEGFASLFSLGRAVSGSRIIVVVFAVISIVAGFTLVLSPLWSAVFLWWFAGIALIVLGALNVGRAIIGRAPAATDS